jgi:hypothetical protein
MASDVVGRQLENVPVGTLIRKIGESIADAQLALDRNAIQALNLLGSREHGVLLPGESEARSMLELGFVPTFFHFNNATIEAMVTFSVTEGREVTVGASAGFNIGIFSATVNASYTSKYSFSAAASSTIRANLVSVPAPQVLTDLIQKRKPQQS